jgi:hypothetical protein
MSDMRSVEVLPQKIALTTVWMLIIYGTFKA